MGTTPANPSATTATSSAGTLPKGLARSGYMPTNMPATKNNNNSVVTKLSAEPDSQMWLVATARSKLAISAW